MVSTLKKIVEELLYKTEALRQEREQLISRCQRNCANCRDADCQYRINIIKAHAPMFLHRGKR